ncbi:MAG: hypothetical protein QF569_25305, partial [Candidatus Poribacteria bacterium]|nr:hypothetical protein [Candidatus Poribacteria bacterium]
PPSKPDEYCVEPESDGPADHQPGFVGPVGVPLLRSAGDGWPVGPANPEFDSRMKAMNLV